MSLFGLGGGKDRHPLHSPEAAERLIDLLSPSDPLKALGDLTQWLESVTQADDFKAGTRIEVIDLLDDAAREPERMLMLRYFKDPRLRNASGRILWGAVAQFWAALADAWQRCARENLPDHPVVEAGRAAAASLAARAMRARVTQMRILMLHYEPIGTPVWSGLYELLSRCEKADVLAAATHAYAAEKLHTTPLAETMIGLLVAIASPERLPPEEIDAAFRIARRFAGAARLEPKPFAGATHVLDLARPALPQRWVSGTTAPERACYLGACEAVARLEHMLGNFELDMLDEDVRVAREFSPGQRMTVLRQFMAWWGDHPPQPERQLIRLEGGMRVAHGFHTICQTIPHVVARAEREGADGATLEVEDTEEMEPPETWPEDDAGLHVVHAHAGPDVGAWAEVGELTAIRIHDRSEWWLAVIRQLAPGPQRLLRAEFEVLSRKPFGAWLRVMGREETSAANWQAADGFAFEYLQGIVLTDSKVPGQAGTIIVPKSKFVPRQVLELLHGGKSRLLRLTEFREQGKDFDWCVFEWA